MKKTMKPAKKAKQLPRLKLHPPKLEEPIYHIQRRIAGQRRIPMKAGLLGKIREAVDREAIRFGVSRSFVIAVALAETFGIKEQEKY